MKVSRFKSICLFLLISVNFCVGHQITLKSGKTLIFETPQPTEEEEAFYRLLLRDGKNSKDLWSASNQPLLVQGYQDEAFSTLHHKITSFFEDKDEVTILIGEHESGGILIHINHEIGELSRPVRRLSSFWIGEDLKKWSLVGHDQMAFQAEGSPRKVYQVTKEGIIDGLFEGETSFVGTGRSDRPSRGLSTPRRESLKRFHNQDYASTNQKINDSKETATSKSFKLLWITSGLLLLIILILILKSKVKRQS